MKVLAHDVLGLVLHVEVLCSKQMLEGEQLGNTEDRRGGKGLGYKWKPMYLRTGDPTSSYRWPS